MEGDEETNSTQPSGDVKEGKSSSSHLMIKVVGQDKQETHFKCKPKTPLKKIMDAYCDRNSKKIETCRFLFDGARVNPESTPESLEMEDGDCIDVMHEQVGGAAARN